MHTEDKGDSRSRLHPNLVRRRCPPAAETGTATTQLQEKTKKWKEQGRTVSVFQGLLLFGGLGDDFDPLAEEDADVGAVSVEHLDR